MDRDYPAAVRMLLALADVPPERRTDVLALVCKVYIEHPDWLIILKQQKEKK